MDLPMININYQRIKISKHCSENQPDLPLALKGVRLIFLLSPFRAGAKKQKIV